ncbi:MAG: GDP-L-fucose synthase family protein [Candidatus Xenobia bacterium]
MDWSKKRVVVTGGQGFLGHSVVKALQAVGCETVIPVARSEYDLLEQSAVRRLFTEHKPHLVFHLAGLVGGILPNKLRPAEFYYENLMVGTMVFHEAWKSGAEKFIAAGAGCGYPLEAPMPLQEKDFWVGLPQPESAPYSLAKRMLTIQSEAYYRQYGFVSIICIPGNLYGPWDNFRLLDAHVIPALVRKFVEAEMENSPYVEVWGSGMPTRDFVYVEDAAQAMLLAVEKYNQNEIVNISSGVESRITEVCELLKELTSFRGEIRWNTERPDGQLRRCFDLTKLKRDLAFVPQTDLRSGLSRTVEWYRANLPNALVRR